MESLLPLSLFAPPRDMRALLPAPSATEGALCAAAILHFMTARPYNEQILLNYFLRLPPSPAASRAHVICGCCINCGAVHSNYIFTANCARCREPLNFALSLRANVCNKAAEEIGSATVMEILGDSKWPKA